MGFFKKFSSLFVSSEDKRNFWFFVQCDFCKEVIKGRVDLQNDLSLDYGEKRNESSYFCRKVLVGSNRCYRPIEVEFRFDTNRKLLDRQIQGGKFLSEEEYNRVVKKQQ